MLHLVPPAFGRLFRGVSCPARRGAASAVLALSVVLAGCGDGSSSSGNGGSGGSATTSSSGGSGGTTTTPMFDVCPTKAETHVVATVVSPADGKAIGAKEASVTGTVKGAGVDTPPSFECGGGEAWVQIAAEDMSGDWLACFQAPGLVVSIMPGESAELVQTVKEHPSAPATLHTTLRVAGALFVHVEWAGAEDEIALPDGVTVARSEEKVCVSPGDPCDLEGYAVTASEAGQSAVVMPGETASAGAFQLYLDRYWVPQSESGCEGGAADIRIAVTPAPP